MLPPGIELEFKRHCQFSSEWCTTLVSRVNINTFDKVVLEPKKKVVKLYSLVFFEDRIQDRSNGSCNKTPVRIKQSTSIKGERKEEIEN